MGESPEAGSGVGAEEKGGGMLLRRLSLLAGRALGLEAGGSGWSQSWSGEGLNRGPVLGMVP